jgi:hypothetical protein
MGTTRKAIHGTPSCNVTAFFRRSRVPPAPELFQWRFNVEGDFVRLIMLRGSYELFIALPWRIPKLGKRFFEPQFVE